MYLVYCVVKNIKWKHWNVDKHCQRLFVNKNIYGVTFKKIYKFYYFYGFCLKMSQNFRFYSFLITLKKKKVTESCLDLQISKILCILKTEDPKPVLILLSN